METSGTAGGACFVFAVHGGNCVHIRVQIIDCISILVLERVLVNRQTRKLSKKCTETEGEQLNQIILREPSVKPDSIVPIVTDGV